LGLGIQALGFALDLPARLLPSTTSTPAATATTFAAAAATAPEPAPASKAAATRDHWPGFVHRERPAPKAMLMELRDGILCILLGCHFYEREAASPASFSVARVTYQRELTGFRKQGSERVLVYVVGKVPDIQFVAHDHSAHRIDALWKLGARSGMLGLGWRRCDASLGGRASAS